MVIHLIAILCLNEFKRVQICLIAFVILIKYLKWFEI